MSDVLATLTREQREAVRVLIARAWMDGDDRRFFPSVRPVALKSGVMVYAVRALPEPPPRTVTRPRVEKFGQLEWRILGSEMQARIDEDDTWDDMDTAPPLYTRDDAARWLALWDAPTETVEVPDDA